ncbi:MAG: radical SAM protein [Escherichia coli]|nr:radical SAM protein [Escherichia coli]
MIFNIQRYSTHDGPGIRTVVFLKGCSLGCRWCQNPESRARTQDLLYDREKLTPEHLTALTDCCPTQALTVCGEVKSVEEIMTTVLRDKPFYDRSGGGLTLSGGEPFMQPEMAMALLQASHEAGIHTAVETCLHVPWKYIAPSLPYIDLFLADLKHVKIIIRVPLIQGFNADETSVKAITDFAADELHVGEIHFLPYHTLGINKYHLLNLPYDAPEKPLDAPELLDFAQQYACQKGLTATLRG